MTEVSPLPRRVRAGRLADDLWRLVSVPSPTGQEHAAAALYAEMLAETGMEVELRNQGPRDPTVVGRLAGRGPGRVLQLAGHLDHIGVPHGAPVRTRTTISARGAADMKAGLAGIVEAVRVLGEAGRPFAGEIMVTAYGGHEAPQGKSQGLSDLISRATIGNAAIVAECDYSLRSKAVVAGKGQAIWTLTLRRRGEVRHEVVRPRRADALLTAATQVAAALRDEDRRLRQSPPRHRLLGAPSVFTGQLHYGDFYNRAPATCWLQGTRRWLPSRSIREISSEFAQLIARLPLPKGISATTVWQLVGSAYEIDRREPIVTALRRAHRDLTGRPMPLAGTATVFDANRLVSWASVPTVLISFENETSHADREVVYPARLVAPCQLLLTTALRYLQEGAH